MKRILNNEEARLELHLGDTFWGLNDTGYAKYHVYAFKWKDREDKDNSILYLITKDGMKFIYGKNAFLSKEDAKTALISPDEIKLGPPHEETSAVKRGGNTYFDRIMAELNRQEVDAGDMPCCSCCCCGENDKKSINNLCSNSSANKFNFNYQDLILIEEMNELTKELLEARRGKDNADKIREKMRLVLTSIDAVHKLMGTTPDEFNEEADKKLEKHDVDKTSSVTQSHKVEDSSKKIKIKNSYEAIKLFEKNPEKSLKIEKDGKLYDVNDFFKDSLDEKSAFIIRSYRLLPKEELREMDASPYEEGIKAEELADEIKKCTFIISRALSKDSDEYLEDSCFLLTFDNWKLYEMTAEINEKDIIFRSTGLLFDEIEED